MKITKRQLQRIIREERTRIHRNKRIQAINEAIGGTDAADAFESAAVALLEELLSGEMAALDLDPDQAAQIVRNSLDNVLDLAVKGLNQTADDDYDPDRPY